jgi:hypothetical protein
VTIGYNKGHHHHHHLLLRLLLLLILILLLLLLCEYILLHYEYRNELLNFC